MSFLIANGYLTAACGCGNTRPPAPKPAVDENEPPIVVDEPGTQPEPEEDPDWHKKGGPGAGGGYLNPPCDSVVLSSAAPRSKA